MDAGAWALILGVLFLMGMGFFFGLKVRASEIKLLEEENGRLRAENAFRRGQGGKVAEVAGEVLQNVRARADVPSGRDGTRMLLGGGGDRPTNPSSGGAA